MIYHVFNEEEVFSEVRGGALSRWAANVLRDEVDTKLAFVDADSTWGFPSDKLILLPQLRRYMKYRGRRLYPSWLNSLILRPLLRPVIERVRKGDVVWVRGNPSIAMALSGQCREVGAKLVMHFSSFPENNPVQLKRLFTQTDAVVSCSKYLSSEIEKRFASHGNTRFYHIYNGADIKLFYPEPSRDRHDIPEILFVGRMVSYKGIHKLLDAMRILKERGVRAKASIIGASFFASSQVTPYMQSLYDAAPDNVVFDGYVSGAPLAARFRKADIFCCPSIWQEPLGMVVVEAMASQVPVVATRVGGIPEWFIDGGGLLVPPDNAVALADALESLIKEPLKREEIAKQGRESFLHHFTWADSRASYRKILESL